WLAKYSGDDNNEPASSKCADEAVLVISPHITILKTPDQQTIVAGQTASFTIQVINDGDSNLSNVTVTDVLSPDCNRTSAQLPGLALMKPAPDPSSTLTYTCTLANVTAGFTNTAVATGTPPVGPNVHSSFTNVAVVTGHAGGTTLTAQDTAPVTAKAPFVPKVIPKVVSHKKPKATG